MRTLIAIAFVAAFGVTAAHASDTAQVAAKEPAASVAAREPVTNVKARDIARAWLKANNYRFGRIGDIRQRDGNFVVELQSADGIRFKTLKIDAATGEIVG